jgi:hypothetical protein
VIACCRKLKNLILGKPVETGLMQNDNYKATTQKYHFYLRSRRGVIPLFIKTSPSPCQGEGGYRGIGSNKYESSQKIDTDSDR